MQRKRIHETRQRRGRLLFHPLRRRRLAAARQKHPHPEAERPTRGILAKVVRFALENRFVVVLGVLALVAWGIMVAPFAWDLPYLPRDPVPVDAIPDIGENQQIVFSEWPGRSPQDVENHVTYPLTATLLGMPGVQSVRSYSMFGFSMVYVIFDEEIEFYWSRNRVLEKLDSLPPGALPPDVKPLLGPDATPLGQVFWYTLEGRDPEGNPAGGWDLQELRSIQDWIVRFELLAVPGVAEVASIGGMVQEYQVELDPDAMRQYDITLPQVVDALRKSNVDIGARTLEINQVEYVVRGLGLVRTSNDLGAAVVRVRDNVPIRVRDVGHVQLGPALRRGALDKEGAEAVGGVVVVRYGENPLAVIRRVKDKIRAIETTLPSKTVRLQTPEGPREVQAKLQVVPFYDRTTLIHETLDTLNRALVQQICVTIIVVVVMLLNLRSSLLISGLLPLAVLFCFIAMRYTGVDANIVALSGIAIAIGTMVDMGIVLNENILQRLDENRRQRPVIDVIEEASVEVGGAVIAAVLTTVVSFLPVFTMQAAEGRLFRPLAMTKTYALLASLGVAILLIPPAAYTLFRPRSGVWGRRLFGAVVVLLGALAGWAFHSLFLFVILALLGLSRIVGASVSDRLRGWLRVGVSAAVAVAVGLYLARDWIPLGVQNGLVRNLVFVLVLIGVMLLAFRLFQAVYPSLLRWCLEHKATFLALPLLLVLFGITIWLGFARSFGGIPAAASRLGLPGESLRRSRPWVAATHAFPGLGREFMPDLDEGAFLLMPTTMPHASIGEALDVLRKQDMALTALPEINTAVGKIGRVDSALDPAPVSMIETIINYHNEYLLDETGARQRFAFAPQDTDLFRSPDGTPQPAPDGAPYVIRGRFLRREGNLVPDPHGEPFRLWRPPLDPDLNPERSPWPGIRSPNDIWDEILRVTQIPGTTSAPRLQPIAARLVMLQSGMRAPMGVKVLGKGTVTLEDLEAVAVRIESLLKEVPSVKTSAVIADRIVGKPYLELDIDRDAAARHGINVQDVQAVIQGAVGGTAVTTVQHGRERYQALVRYKRELRDSIESLEQVLVPAAGRAQIPLKELLLERRVHYRRGPQMIKSEDGALATYVLFDKQPGQAEVEVVEHAASYLQSQLQAGKLQLPKGVTYHFAGSYENQVRSTRRLRLVLPLALFLIFIILYLQFRSTLTTFMVFSGIAVAWSGGFVMIWLYGQDWFLNVSVFGENLRQLFQMQPINLSVAIWVGFIALFGIATDDGVVMATYLDQTIKGRRQTSIADIRGDIVEGACRRVRPCLMTTATTVLALLPVLTATGRGADIMVPMAIPSFGGMCLELITMFVVPVLYCLREEAQAKLQNLSD